MNLGDQCKLCKYFDPHHKLLRIRAKLMKHLRLELIENLIFNKKADHGVYSEELPAKIEQYMCNISKTGFLSSYTYISYILY